MKKLLPFIGVLFLSVGFVSCSDDDKAKSGVDFVTDYELSEGGEWIIPELNVVYRIDSEEDFLRYADFDGENTGSGIDFRKYTLLLVQIYSLSGINSVERELIDNLNRYELNIIVENNMTAMVEGRTIAVLSSKLSTDKDIKLNLDCKSCAKSDYEDDIPTTDYVLPGSCSFQDFQNYPISDTYSLLYIRIDSEDEYLKHLDCNNAAPASGIDFEKRTLLVVSGVLHVGVHSIKRVLTEEADTYNLILFVEEGMTDALDMWTVAYTTPKLSKNKALSFTQHIIRGNSGN